MVDGDSEAGDTTGVAAGTGMDCGSRCQQNMDCPASSWWPTDGEGGAAEPTVVWREASDY